MKNSVALLGLTIVLGIGLFGAESLAQNGAGVAPVLVVPATRAATKVAPTCVGEMLLEVTIDGPQAMRITHSKPLGAASWGTDLTLTGRVEKGGDTCAASATFLIHADEPEARAALQTCAMLAASLAPGRKLSVSTQSTSGATALANGGVRVVRPLEVGCRIR